MQKLNVNPLSISFMQKLILDPKSQNVVSESSLLETTNFIIHELNLFSVVTVGDKT